MTFLKALAWLAPIVAIFPATAQAQASGAAVKVSDAELLSEFGGRAAFSPDGKRIAFVGRTYGDAFEIDLATRAIRNLTRDIPHHGVVRIQYLPSGDYLVTAPSVSPGANERAHLELWVLDRALRKGLRRLGARVFEGVAVSRRANRIAWTAIEPELKPNEAWQLGFGRPTKRYTAEITYRNGAPELTDRREIMATLPKDCIFIEPQDFRDQDRELIYSCIGPMTGAMPSISVMGATLADGATTVYFRRAGQYAEAEGIAPSGDWTTVECGDQAKGALSPLDICRLDLQGDGGMARLVTGSTPGRPETISNPVVSPDGKWLAFQRSIHGGSDIGGGDGIYLLGLPETGR